MHSQISSWVANAIQKPVYAGQVECASVGNILMQAVSKGEVQRLSQLREVVKKSFDIKTFEPVDRDLWETGYGKYPQAVENQ